MLLLSVLLHGHLSRLINTIIKTETDHQVKHPIPLLHLSENEPLICGQ